MAGVGGSIRSRVHRDRDGNLASGSVGSPGKAFSRNASRSDGSMGSRKLRRKSWAAMRNLDCMDFRTLHVLLPNNFGPTVGCSLDGTRT